MAKSPCINIEYNKQQLLIEAERKESSDVGHKIIRAIENFKNQFLNKSEQDTNEA